MHTAAVIAEFNPFHSGHAYLLREARRISGADFIIVVMSGDFVQRGAPAIFDKYTRTEMALHCGADLVLELPAAISCGSAQRFAEGAVQILDSLGVVDELWFGSECGDMEPFLALSSITAEETEEYHRILRPLLACGKTFPQARAEAICSLLSLSGQESRKLRNFLRSPNNILGLEYCSALKKQESRIIPRTLPRRGAAYHENNVDKSLEFLSAKAIRARLTLPGSRNSLLSLAPFLPCSCIPLYQREISLGSALTEDDFSSMLLYRLSELKEARRAGIETDPDLYDVPHDLLQRMMNLIPRFCSFSQFADLVKTRNTTRTQVNRALLHILLHLERTDLELALHPKYIRMLGMRTCPELLSGIKKESRLPLISRASALRSCSGGKDLFTSELYESVKSLKTGQPFIPEYSRPVIVLPKSAPKAESSADL